MKNKKLTITDQARVFINTLALDKELLAMNKGE